MAERFQGGFGLFARQCQFGGQGAGVDLLGRPQAVELHLFEDAVGARDTFLLVSQVCGSQAQQGGLFGLALGGLLQQLLDAGLRGARQLSQGG
jgi:hypothetical protein